MCVCVLLNTFLISFRNWSVNVAYYSPTKQTFTDFMDCTTSFIGSLRATFTFGLSYVETDYINIGELCLISMTPRYLDVNTVIIAH